MLARRMLWSEVRKETKEAMSNISIRKQNGDKPVMSARDRSILGSLAGDARLAVVGPVP